ncbi:hypothetical protein [Burkholderia cenocepacia]|uniref:hypothetical protein n=1 Tax=Burkholderia cenocepacia TaxID=95486 RepID=UPI001CF12C9A|nr:hypothetical protein [Burkholderia cenocepacia]MCA8233184.1 hypothetical protein [Burkholderia cenocepacia]
MHVMIRRPLPAACLVESLPRRYSGIRAGTSTTTIEQSTLTEKEGQSVPRAPVRSRFGPFAMPALLLALFPSTTHADAGELGRIAMAAFTFASAVWVLLTLVVFAWFLRRMPLLKRLAWTVLFFCLPVLTLGGELLTEYALGGYRGRDEVTTKPLVVLGATFPPGSHAVYDGEGGFFGWGAKRTLQSIHAPQSVLLGNVPIDGLIFIPESCCDRARAEVTAGTVIDGWPCGETNFDLTPAGPAIRSCFLAAPVTWHGKEWPAGSFVEIAEALAPENAK